MNEILGSSTWADFMSSIRLNPDDHTTRLVLADWLQEHDQPALTAWAEFIRMQIAAALASRSHVYSDSCDCDVCRPERRSLMLHDQWGRLWEACAGPWVSDGKRSAPTVKDYKLGLLEEMLNE